MLSAERIFGPDTSRTAPDGVSDFAGGTLIVKVYGSVSPVLSTTGMRSPAEKKLGERRHRESAKYHPVLFIVYRTGT